MHPLDPRPAVPLLAHRHEDDADVGGEPEAAYPQGVAARPLVERL